MMLLLPSVYQVIFGDILNRGDMEIQNAARPPIQVARVYNPLTYKNIEVF